MLAVHGLNHGKPTIWTAFQNGIGPMGQPGAGGATQSTVAGYDLSTGTLIRTIQVNGKVDGLTAAPEMGVLIATVNEDGNSALNLIYPATGAVAAYTYLPSPEVSGNGGTDSIAIIGGQIYVSHSNPNDAFSATDYTATLDNSGVTLIAHLTPVFNDNAAATDAATGSPVTLALTDPDTNLAIPEQSPRFAGGLATIGQADGVVVFATHLDATPQLSQLTVTEGGVGVQPDGLTVATSDHGTLYVIDNAAGTITALDTTGWAAGTVFVGSPGGIGTLNLSTGVISPLANGFGSPKGLLFVPAHEGDSGGEGGDILGGLLG